MAGPPSGSRTTSASGQPAAASTGGTTRSPIRWFVQPAGDTAKDAVQLAVQRFWSVFTRLAEQPGAADSELTQVAADPVLARLMRAFQAEAQQGKRERGPLDGSITAVSVSGVSARATSCLDLTKVQSYQSNGRPVPGTRGGMDRYVLTLRRVGGVWKVIDYDSPQGSTCSVRP